MPKTYLTREMRLRENLAIWIYGQMKVNHLSQRKVAGDLGLTQQGLCLKLKKQSFSFDDFVFFMKLFQPDEETLKKLVGADEWTKG